jgi:dynein heavy chain
MQPEVLGYRCLYDSWKMTLPKEFTSKNTFLPTLDKLYKNWVDETLDLLRRYLKECSPTLDNNLVSSLFKIINCFFHEYIASELKKVGQEEIDHLHTIVEQVFVFALIWSLCCTVNAEGR